MAKSSQGQYIALRSVIVHLGYLSGGRPQALNPKNSRFDTVPPSTFWQVWIDFQPQPETKPQPDTPYGLSTLPTKLNRVIAAGIYIHQKIKRLSAQPAHPMRTLPVAHKTPTS